MFLYIHTYVRTNSVQNSYMLILNIIQYFQEGLSIVVGIFNWTIIQLQMAMKIIT